MRFTSRSLICETEISSNQTLLPSAAVSSLVSVHLLVTFTHKKTTLARFSKMASDVWLPCLRQHKVTWLSESTFWKPCPFKVSQVGQPKIETPSYQPSFEYLGHYWNTECFLAERCWILWPGEWTLRESASEKVKPRALWNVYSEAWNHRTLASF